MNKQEIENLIEYVKDHSNNFLGSKATLQEKETFEYMYDLLIETLEKQLTNYDVDKVVEQLQSNCHNYYPSIDYYCMSQKVIKLKDAVAIVKGVVK